MSFELELPDLAATGRFGRLLGSMIEPGTVIGLEGPLGAGKTHLARALAEGLNIPNPALVTSPTFVLIQEYPARLPIYHFDAYRLTGADAFRDLGAEEYLFGSGVCLIEWPSRVQDALPADRLTIDFQIRGPEQRSIRLTAGGPQSRQLRDRLEKSRST